MTNWRKIPKEHKKMSKKKLLWHLERQMFSNMKIVWENYMLNNTLNRTEQDLKSAENALNYKEKVIEKYKKLLSISVEDL